ncbi:MAG: DUF2189 domain-containing protein [Rhodobiaceae bacterium]|nr:DUF2189 domain-containing protein [Rhodobiaceae bacterium]MCC0054400.1 DUF2189 domain-containing protein [Rhodobiaceae bacterium]
MNAKSTKNSDAQTDVLALPEGYRAPPKVRSFTFAEVVAAAGRGMQDFRSAGLTSALFGIAYAIGGIIVILTAAWSDLTWISYPLATGFALIGPFAAVGLYDISRRLEAGTPLRLSEIMGVVWAQHRREIGWMAFVVLFVFTAWMYQVRLLLALFIGFEPIASYADFFHALFTTPNGLIFLAVGHVVGAILAVILFSLSVISFPILLDRDIDFITAMITSVQTVVKNPLPMLGWAFVVVMLLIAASLPMFLGLVVVLPILGHATWHIYRMAIEPEEAPAPAKGK